MFKFRCTDRSPTSPGIGYELITGPIGSKPATNQQPAEANDLAKSKRSVANEPVVKSRDSRSAKSVVDPVSKPLGTPNEQAD
nr:hypothetical protein [uncultured Campylobacter sp.]